MKKLAMLMLILALAACCFGCSPSPEEEYGETFVEMMTAFFESGGQDVEFYDSEDADISAQFYENYVNAYEVGDWEKLNEAFEAECARIGTVPGTSFIPVPEGYEDPSEKPSDFFISAYGKFFESPESYRVINGNGVDITEEFYDEYIQAYANHDWDSIHAYVFNHDCSLRGA